MKRGHVFLNFVLILLFSIPICSQELNQINASGKRTGVWKKFYENGDIRYEGQFENGKEVGTFKFYNQGSSYPSIIKEFSKTSDSASVKFYTKSRLKTQGKMIGKKRVGKWTYFFSDGETIFSEEFYLNGQLNGILKNYYLNGQVTEATEYSEGKKHGVSKVYTEDGVLIEEVHYEYGKLNGEAKYFDLKGVIKEKGLYENGKRKGKWEFYIDGEISEKGRKRTNILKDDDEPQVEEEE